jgi:hypothetical protein
MFYVLYFNLFTLSLNILFLMLYEVFVYAIGVELMCHPFGNDASHMNL